VCPECGQEYNARPLVHRGILCPGMTPFPLGDILSTLLCAVVAIHVAGRCLEPINWGFFFFVVPLFLLVILLAHRAVRNTGAYLHTRRIERRILREEMEQ